MRLGVMILAALLSGAAVAASAQPVADAALVQKGADAFRDNCAGCHLDVIAPSLNGVVGRKIAGGSDFDYSAALKAKGGTWTDANLDAWLTNSQAFAPGSSMVMAVPDPATRAALIAYLKTLK